MEGSDEHGARTPRGAKSRLREWESGLDFVYLTPFAAVTNQPAHHHMVAEGVQ